MIIEKLDHNITTFFQRNQPETDVEKIPLEIKFFMLITNSIAPPTVIFILTILIALSLVSGKHVKEEICLVLSVLPVVIGSRLKKLFSKPRPDESKTKIWVVEKSYNMPSTHAGVAACLYGFLAYLVVYFDLPIILVFIPLMMIALISYSRIYLGAHYFSDVICGIVLGFVVLVPIIYFYNYAPVEIFSIKLLWLLTLIGWIFIVNYYRKLPEEIPDFMKKFGTMLKRTFTGIAVLIIAIIPIWIGGKLFAVFMLGIYFVSIFEIISANPNNKKYFLRSLSILVLGLMIWSTILLRYLEHGRELALLFVFTAVISDISGLLVGKKFGKHKIFEKISPNKTLEGYIAAFLVPSFIIGSILFFKYELMLLEVCFISSLLSFSAILGDGLESLLKRTLQVKDTSNFLPGHGGILDRIDSSLMVATVLYLITVLFLKYIF